MRTSIRAAVALLALFTFVGLGGATASAGQTDDGLTICHRTNSNANPYVTITTDLSGQNGGTDHFNEHQGPLWNDTLKKQKIEWGDVIPPYGDRPGSQAWQELEESGQGNGDAFIDDGCQTTPVPTHDVTLDKVTTGDGAPAADTTFTFSVSCESGEVNTPVTIAPEDDPVTIAAGVAEDDRCTVTETASNGASSITFEATGGTVDSTTASSVTFGVGDDVSVVATNDFPGQVEEPETGDVTLDKVVTGSAAPADTTTYDFTVVCDSGTVTSPVSIATTDEAKLVADDVEQGDECTITETGSHDAEDISFVVTGGTVGSTTDSSVTFTVDGENVSVVATNGYADVLGEVITPPKAPAPVVEPATLPRTGASDMTPYYAMAGAALVLGGSLVRLASRRLAGAKG